MPPLLLEGEAEHLCRRCGRRWGRRVKFFSLHRSLNVGQEAEWLMSEAEFGQRGSWEGGAVRVSGRDSGTRVCSVTQRVRPILGRRGFGQEARGSGER